MCFFNIIINTTTLQLKKKKSQDFQWYNEFDKNIRKKVTLYDKFIIQRKHNNW